MDPAWAWTLGSVAAVSLASLAGALVLAVGEERLGGLLLLLVSFSAGALFGDVFLHLLPHAVAERGFGPAVSLPVIAGILAFFVLEKFVCWRHCHVPTSEDHPHPLVAMNLVGDGLHNLIDGMVVAASYLAGIKLGLATTLAVVLHEVPQELGDMGVLLHAGLGRRRALWYNFLCALAAVVGAVATLAFGSGGEALVDPLIPFTAGGFLYIAGSDLIPELKRETGARRSAAQLVCMALGIAVMWALTWVEV